MKRLKIECPDKVPAAGKAISIDNSHAIFYKKKVNVKMTPYEGYFTVYLIDRRLSDPYQVEKPINPGSSGTVFSCLQTHVSALRAHVTEFP